MERELRSYFLRILYSLTAFVVWLVANMTGGIYLGWLFFENNMKTGNIIFYLFLLLSFAWLMWYFVKLWKGKAAPKP